MTQPTIVVITAASLDGRVALGPGRTQWDELEDPRNEEPYGGGGAMYTSPPLVQHFGLAAGKRYRVEVLFPASGKRVVVDKVALAQTSTIREPE